MRRRSTRLAAGIIALGFIAAACSETTTNDTAATTAAPPTTAASETTPTEAAAVTEAAPAATEAAPAATEAPAPTEAAVDVNAWALDYTGGAAGAAAGDPIKIGYVNQEDFFPENTIGLEAARDYINAELGGAAGRPLELVPCKVSTPEDGAKCGTEMANNPEITTVVTGTLLVGNKELYDALNGKKPLIVGNGITSDDFTTPAGSAFTAGSPGVVVGMAGFITTQLPDVKTAALIVNNNPSGQAAADLLLGPVVEKAGIAVTKVAVDDTATAADVQAAMTAVGAETADVVAAVLTIQQCINMYDATKVLGITPTVVTTGLCFGTPMTDHLAEVGVGGTVPDGWYFGGYGYSYFRPDYESGMETYIAKVQEYGKPAPGSTTLEYTGFAGPSFANMMTLTKLINGLGADKLDFASVDAAIRGFTGPMMIQAGPLACGKQVILGLPIFVSVCGAQMGIQQYKDGEWLSVADALNGKPIDATKV